MSFLPTVFRRNGHTPDPEAPLREATALLREQRTQYDDSMLYMQERLAELELALEDQGWQRLMDGSEREFSRDALKRICALSRLMYLKNPLINRAVSLQASYVFGQGMNISSADASTDDEIQAFMDDTMNKAEITSHQARMLKETDLTVLGNIFFVLFSDTQQNVKVRSIPVDEIDRIICNPEDAKDVWYYRRVWRADAFDERTGQSNNSEQREAYYPDWRYVPASKQPTINGKPVMWDAPVYHLKDGGMSEMKFGVPCTYAALDWATAYKSFLEDVASQMRALTRFAHQLTTPNTRGVSAAKTRLNTTLGVGGNAETNPPALPGSTFIGSQGTRIDPINVANAAVKAEDGRRFLLMVAAATGLPETFFGDASVGTLATAKSLDRPTELKMIDRRTLWGDAFKDILGYAIAKKTSRGPVVLEGADKPQIDVDFPDLLEHDVTESVNAIVQAATLGGKPLAGTFDMELVARLLLTALGEDDVDELLAKMTLEPPVPPVDPNAPPTQPPTRQSTEALMVEAVRELRRAVQEAREA